jgi:hypothetical protein
MKEQTYHGWSHDDHKHGHMLICGIFLRVFKIENEIPKITSKDFP